MRRLNKTHKQGTKKSQIILSIILALAMAVVVFVLWWIRENTRTENNKNDTNLSQLNDKLSESSEQKSSSEKNTTPKELFEAEKLQNVLNKWQSEQTGTASVGLMSVDGELLASVNKDRHYFAASIYKLYVAYAGYLRLDEGLNNKDELYINGNTRGECLDLMIRESDSPCAEKLWNELGKSELTEHLKTYGIENTSMTALNTTAYDSALMLARIASGQGLSSVSQEAFLDSMKNQIFRDSLNKGFSSDVIVYNKIGFNGVVEYHDTAIVEFSDGRKLIVSVLTEGVGTRNIANLARDLEASISLLE